MEVFFEILKDENERVVLYMLQTLFNLYSLESVDYISTNGVKIVYQHAYVSIFSNNRNHKTKSLRIQALEALSMMCCHDNIRGIILESLGTESFVARRQDPSTSIEERKELNRLLNAMGAHIPLHFPPSRTTGLRILGKALK